MQARITLDRTEIEAIMTDYIKQQTGKDPEYLQVKAIPYVNLSNGENQGYTVELVASVEVSKDE